MLISIDLQDQQFRYVTKLTFLFFNVIIQKYFDISIWHFLMIFCCLYHLVFQDIYCKYVGCLFSFFQKQSILEHILSILIYKKESFLQKKDKLQIINLTLIRMSILQIGNFQYSTQHLIGKGYSSMVFKGVDRTTGYPVVIKVIDVSKKTSVENQLLQNQIRALQMMEHPYILETYTVKRYANSIYIVCQSCEGDLMRDIKQSGAYTQNEALDTLTFLAHAVNYIHSVGILHRDLKPSNILLKGDGTIRIGDFGFCEFLKERSNSPKRYNVGSPLYMSPEAYKNTQYSTKSDCWALGVIFYQMLIGQTPFKGMTYEIMIQNIENGYLIGNLQVSQFSKYILYRLLDTDPEKRWGTEKLIQILNKRKADYDYDYQSGYPINSSFYKQTTSSCCCC